MPTWKEMGFPTHRSKMCMVCRKTKHCGAVMVVRRGRQSKAPIVNRVTPSWCCAECWRDNPLVVYNP